MNCRDIESLILAERDGVLTPVERAALSDHVAACGSCQRRRTALRAASEAFKADAARVAVPDADEAWRDLRERIAAEGRPSRKRPLAPVIWFGAPLAAAAAIAVAFLAIRAPVPSDDAPALAPYDPSVIAGADYVEAGDPNAATMIYLDKESGWLVVWATDPASPTSG